MEILNQIEGLQVNDKINLEIEKDKEKFNNKIKKFNVTKRLPLNQKMQINSAPDNLIFYGGNSDSLGDGEDNFEEEDERDEEEEDDQDEGNKEEENDIIKKLLKQNEINNYFFQIYEKYNDYTYYYLIYYFVIFFSYF